MQTSHNSFVIKFLHNQMQKQIDIDPQLPLKEVHELRVVELRLQQIVQWDLRVRARDHHVAGRAIDGEHADLVRRKRQVHAIPLALAVAAPVHEDAFVRQGAGGVLERAELEGAA